VNLANQFSGLSADSIPFGHYHTGSLGAITMARSEAQWRIGVRHPEQLQIVKGPAVVLVNDEGKEIFVDHRLPQDYTRLGKLDGPRRSAGPLRVRLQALHDSETIDLPVTADGPFGCMTFWKASTFFSSSGRAALATEEMSFPMIMTPRIYRKSPSSSDFAN